MKTANRWNVKTKEYEPFRLPEGSTVFCTNANEKVKCAKCAEQMFYGDGYTSKQVVHALTGMRYCVCKSCYVKELEEEKENDNE